MLLSLRIVPSSSSALAASSGATQGDQREPLQHRAIEQAMQTRRPTEWISRFSS